MSRWVSVIWMSARPWFSSIDHEVNHRLSDAEVEKRHAAYFSSSEQQLLMEFMWTCNIFYNTKKKEIRKYAVFKQRKSLTNNSGPIEWRIKIIMFASKLITVGLID